LWWIALGIGVLKTDYAMLNGNGQINENHNFSADFFKANIFWGFSFKNRAFEYKQVIDYYNLHQLIITNVKKLGNN